MTADLEALADRLDAIVEELDELAFDRLRAASEAGSAERPVGDKELVRARRAIEKAAATLREIR